jgi:hypothetical protein
LTQATRRRAAASSASRIGGHSARMRRARAKIGLVCGGMLDERMGQEGEEGEEGEEEMGDVGEEERK